jgi:hypothetical protein
VKSGTTGELNSSNQGYGAVNEWDLMSSEFVGAENTLDDAINNRLEKLLAEKKFPSIRKRDYGLCTFTSDAVLEFLHRDSQEQNYDFKGETYQAYLIHASAMNDYYHNKYLSKKPPTNESLREAREQFHEHRNFAWDCTLMHMFGVVNVNRYPFIADLSFSQFFFRELSVMKFPHAIKPIDKESSLAKSWQVPQDDGLAIRLLKKGFAPLTDANFRKYMSFLTIHPGPDYLDLVDASLLTSDNTCEFKLGDNESCRRGPDDRFAKYALFE